MQVVVLKDRLDYDGSQLHHAFAYEMASVLGPSIVVFQGAADVKSHLVDLEDLLRDDFIKSDDMWHFIIEIPEATITETVALQRLFMCTCVEHLKYGSTSNDVERCGDDIYYKVYSDGSQQCKKLSVSIATLSRFSGLIHVGINISAGVSCPVNVACLKEMRVSSKNFGKTVAKMFAAEYVNIKDATYKVTAV